MATSLAVEPTLSSFQALHERLALSRAEDASFFSEWQTPTAPLDDGEKAFLDHLQQRYYNYYNADLLTEGTVLLSIVAPLLEHLGFHEPPFFVRSEVPVLIEVVERDEIYRERMDVLVVRDRLWILTVEAKRSKFAADIALPQCLAYMSAAPQQPSFGLVTNGSDFIFCKLENKLYDFSEAFSLLSRRNRLYEIASILTCLKTLSNHN
ncbi:MAG: type I restriction endonuclease [Phormidesmis sp.]